MFSFTHAWWRCVKRGRVDPNLLQPGILPIYSSMGNTVVLWKEYTLQYLFTLSACAAARAPVTPGSPALIETRSWGDKCSASVSTVSEADKNVGNRLQNQFHDFFAWEKIKYPRPEAVSPAGYLFLMNIKLKSTFCVRLLYKVMNKVQRCLKSPLERLVCSETEKTALSLKACALLYSQWNTRAFLLLLLLVSKICTCMLTKARTVISL